MQGFIIASVNKKEIKQSVGLESHLVRYTPAIADNEEELVKQYLEGSPEYLVLMTMPIDVLKNNIAIIESLAKQNEIVLGK